MIVILLDCEKTAAQACHAARLLVRREGNAYRVLKDAYTDRPIDRLVAAAELHEMIGTRQFLDAASTRREPVDPPADIALVEARIGELNEPYAEMCRLHYLRGQTPPEIARALMKPLGEVNYGLAYFGKMMPAGPPPA